MVATGLFREGAGGDELKPGNLPALIGATSSAGMGGEGSWLYIVRKPLRFQVDGGVFDLKVWTISFLLRRPHPREAAGRDTGDLF